eukprot:513841_1
MTEEDLNGGYSASDFFNGPNDGNVNNESPMKEKDQPQLDIDTTSSPIPGSRLAGVFVGAARMGTKMLFQTISQVPQAAVRQMGYQGETGEACVNSNGGGSDVEKMLLVIQMLAPESRTGVSDKLVALRRLATLVEGPPCPSLPALKHAIAPVVAALEESKLLDKFYAQAALQALEKLLDSTVEEVAIGLVAEGVVEALLSLLEPEFELARITVLEMLELLSKQPKCPDEVEARILKYPMGMQAIVDMLDVNWEEIHTATLALLTSLLHKQNHRESPPSDLQSFVAFAEGYKKLMDIAFSQRYSTLSLDCLSVVESTLWNSPLSQKMFVSGGHVDMLVDFVTFTGRDLMDDIPSAVDDVLLNNDELPPSTTGSSSVGLTRTVQEDGELLNQSISTAVQPGLEGLSLPTLRQMQALHAIRILRTFDGDLRGDVSHCPGIVPAICEIAFAHVEGGGILTWSSYSLFRSLPKEALMTLSSLLRDCPKAQEAFSISYVMGAPFAEPISTRSRRGADDEFTTIETTDGRVLRIRPSQVQPRIALELLFMTLSGVDKQGGGEVQAEKELYDAFLAGNSHWCLEILLHVKQLSVAEVEGGGVHPKRSSADGGLGGVGVGDTPKHSSRSQIASEKKNGNCNSAESKGGFLGAVIDYIAPPPVAIEASSELPKVSDDAYLASLGLLEEREHEAVETAHMRSALALSSLLKRSLLSSEIVGVEGSNGMEVAARAISSVDLIRKLIHSAGSDGASLCAGIPMLAVGIGQPSHRPPTLSALSVALQTFADGYMLALLTASGEVPAPPGDGATSMRTYLFALVKLLATWVNQSAGLAEEALTNGGLWRLLEALAQGFMVEDPDASSPRLLLFSLVSPSDDLKTVNITRLNAAAAALVGVLIARCREPCSSGKISRSSGSAVTRRTLVSGVRRRIKVDYMLLAFEGALAFEEGAGSDEELLRNVWRPCLRSASEILLQGEVIDSSDSAT